MWGIRLRRRATLCNRWLVAYESRGDKSSDWRTRPETGAGLAIRGGSESMPHWRTKWPVTSALFRAEVEVLGLGRLGPSERYSLYRGGPPSMPGGCSGDGTHTRPLGRQRYRSARRITTDPPWTEILIPSPSAPKPAIDRPTSAPYNYSHEPSQRPKR